MPKPVSDDPNAVLPRTAADAGSERCDRRLLELLVCPVTKGPLIYDPARQELVSKRARLAFPIRSGVPLLTVDSARSLDDQ